MSKVLVRTLATLQSWRWALWRHKQIPRTGEKTLTTRTENSELRRFGWKNFNLKSYKLEIWTWVNFSYVKVSFTNKPPLLNNIKYERRKDSEESEINVRGKFLLTLFCWFFLLFAFWGVLFVSSCKTSWKQMISLPLGYFPFSPVDSCSNILKDIKPNMLWKLTQTCS